MTIGPGPEWPAQAHQYCCDLASLEQRTVRQQPLLVNPGQSITGVLLCLPEQIGGAPVTRRQVLSSLDIRSPDVNQGVSRLLVLGLWAQEGTVVESEEWAVVL